MASWSGIRHKLEQEYLADSLRGHIQYYATSYSKSPDHEGRAAIRLDGKEIIKGCYWNNWSEAHLFPRDDTYALRMTEEFAYMDDTAIQLGVFDQCCFTVLFVNLTIRVLKRVLSAKICLSGSLLFWTSVLESGGCVR